MTENNQYVHFEGNYMTVGQLLKKLDIVASGGEVKIFLEERPIRVNGESESRRGRKLYEGDIVQIGRKTFVMKGNSDVSQ